MTQEENKSVTITLSNKEPTSFIKQGEVIVFNAFGRKKYGIVKYDSKDEKGMDTFDEDTEPQPSLNISFTVKPLSKYMLIRIIQIYIFKITH
jgi:hypothetical protein